MSLLSHTAVVGLLVSLVSFAAHPLPGDASAYPPPKLTELTVVSKSSLGGQIGSKVLASCLIRSTGGTCTITRGKTASREVQLSLGMSWASATAQLGIGSGRTVTTTVSCSSPALEAGTSWKARPVGTIYYYKIRKRLIQAGHVLSTTMSSPLKAFNPSASKIACGLH
ncbi:MAG TPA: hypothetical protein VL294_03540 [Pseudolysinimonas sp.]|nr:hypothetical protein [Pseudolysinimonas sp.]